MKKQIAKFSIFVLNLFWIGTMVYMGVGLGILYERWKDSPGYVPNSFSLLRPIDIFDGDQTRTTGLFIGLLIGCSLVAIVISLFDLWEIKNRTEKR